MQAQSLVARPVRYRLIRRNNRALAVRVAGVQDLAETFTAFSYPAYVVNNQKMLTPKVLQLPFVRLPVCVPSVVEPLGKRTTVYGAGTYVCQDLGKLHTLKGEGSNEFKFVDDPRALEILVGMIHKF